MKTIGETVQVNGQEFRILPHDRDMIMNNRHPGVPHLWHGVASNGESRIFGTLTERFKNGNPKKLRTHAIMQ